MPRSPTDSLIVADASGPTEPSANRERRQAYREDAQQEGQVDPRRWRGPVHGTRVSSEGDELQDREDHVPAGEGRDAGQVVLAVRVERREADADQPRSDGPRGQSREGPRPQRSDDRREEEESRAEDEHAAPLAKDQDLHPSGRGDAPRRIASRRANLEPSD